MLYWLCEADGANKLQEVVNQHIRKGWRPIGGIAVVQSQSTSSWWYYQAMVLVEGDPDAAVVADFDAG